ncbi:NAD(P)H-binding protein [Enterococcus montenegrensis]|uniref:NAD(P)H-binding protein n=1 Tax=Enterococcus montenegrensis TaxID=3031993 RepID=UPI003898F702
MSKIMILGANGAMARLVTEKLLNETDHQLVLFLRNADRLSQYKNNNRVQLVDGDIYDTPILLEAMKNVDIVYSNLGGVDLDEQ